MFIHRSLRPAVCFLLLFVWGGSAAAQESAPKNDPASAGVTDAWQRLIYLPYKNLRNVLSDANSTVVLPYAEYADLVKRAAAAAAKPVDAVISESHYTAAIDGDAARIGATLTVQVLADGWTEVPVQFGQAAIGKISDADGKVKLRGAGQGKYAMLFPAKGEYTVELDLTARISSSPDGRRFEFGCPTVGITTFEITVPEADQTIQLTPTLVSLPVEGAEGVTRIKSSLGSTSKIGVLWHPRTGAKPQMDLLAGVTNALHVSIADGLIHSDASLKYDVLRGELNELQIVVPANHRILGVSSTTARIESWDSVEEKTRRLIKVKLLAPVSDTLLIDVHTEAPAGTEPFEAAGIDEDGVVHGIHALDVVRESGQLVVTHGKDLSVTVEGQQGLIRIEEAEVEKSIRRANALSYKFYSSRFSLRIAADPLAPRIQVANSTRLTFGDDELKLESSLAYSIERAGVFVLKLEVPESVTIDSVTAEAMKEFAFDAASRTLTVSFLQKRLGALNMNVSGRQELEADVSENELTLPLLTPLEVERETGSIQVFVPEAIEVVTKQAELVGAQAEPLSGDVRLADTRLSSAWSYTRRPVTIPVRTRRKPTRLTARVGTTIDAREDATSVVTDLEFDVKFAGVDTFRFAVPEQLSSRINVEDAAGIKSSSAAEEAVDGWVDWTIQMQRDVLGRQRFRITYELQNTESTSPDADEGEGADEAKGLEIVPLRALGVESADEGAAQIALSSVSGEVAVQKDRAFSVQVQSEDEGLELIDVRELQFLPQEGYLAFRYFKQPVSMTLNVTKHEIQEVVATVATRALVEIVAGRENWNYRVRFRLRSSERQRLPLTLPKGAELLALLVDQQQVNPEQNAAASTDERDAYFVNVSRTKTSDEVFHVTVQFRVATSDPFSSRTGGLLEFTMPQIGDADSAGVVIQQLRTVLWVPREYALVGTPKEFVREDAGSFMGVLKRVLGMGPGQKDLPQRLTQWIGSEASGIIDFPTEGHAYVYNNLGGSADLVARWWNVPVFTWCLSGLLIVVAWILRKTSWENKFGLLVLLAFVAALFATSDPDWVLHGLVASYYGVIAMIVFWMIHTLLGRPQSGRRRAHRTAATVPPVVPPPGVFDDLKPRTPNPPG
ncbi:MAG: hypothetical protein CMJ48_10710 [Planctomycetaceae bacterium]|nr:hypothetical protein [Planctomycetaceae bacterium]